jgi:predicted TIM-barrel enzyme
VAHTQERYALIDRDTVRRRLRDRTAAGRVILGAGAGNGLSAKCLEAGGVDFIVVYNSGRYRMAGRGSLAGMMPYGDANAVVVDLGSEILPVVRDTPVIAGVCGTDPFRVIPRFVDSLAAMGFSGVQNFPTVGLIDGNFRQNLEETGMGYASEVEMIAYAHGAGLLTTPYVFTPDEAVAMARAGADVLVAHVGLTTSGTIGARTAMSLQEAATAVQAMRDAAEDAVPGITVLCHGGPIAQPADVEYVLDHTEGIAGFVGASSIERLASERAIVDTTSEFSAIALRQPHVSEATS